MQLKPITALAVLSLVVASLLVAGCTTSTTSNTNQTHSASAEPSSAATSSATHDALLERFIVADKNTTYFSNLGEITAEKVTWINSTSARAEWTISKKSQNQTAIINYTYIAFPTTQDATQYLNAMNTIGYNLSSTDYTEGGYANVTGNAPQVYKVYVQEDMQSKMIYGIAQFDNIITLRTTKVSGGEFGV